MVELCLPPPAVQSAEPCGRVPVLAAERRRHVRHVRAAQRQEQPGVVLQPGLPLHLHLHVHLHGAVALHRPHHRLLRDGHGMVKTSSLRGRAGPGIGSNLAAVLTP